MSNMAGDKLTTQPPWKRGWKNFGHRYRPCAQQTPGQTDEGGRRTGKYRG